MEKDIILKYNKPGPRYTSYPPANFFTTEYTQKEYIESLIRSNDEKPDGISLYVHIPFCLRLCYFCACNTSIGKSEEHITQYIDALIREIEMVAAHLDKSRKVTQVHWGGGTPNSISLHLVKKIMDAFYKNFTFSPTAEIAMECSPAYLEYEDIDFLAEIGFNRISLGIQDFNKDVLNAVNRESSKHPVDTLFDRMRSHNFKGNNLDLIYGLPSQTMDTFRTSIEKTLAIMPDRVVTFSYAHVPWVKKLQKRLELMGLPNAEQKLDMFQMAYSMFTDAGYIPMGLDHFARPDDELAIALNNKKLHRNFQGYCTRETTGQVYGFGTSSIGQMHSAYAQNVKNIKEYMEAINKGEFAIERGYRLSTDEIIRRDVINEIMCNGYLSYQGIANRNQTDVATVKAAVAYAPEKLDEFVADNMLTYNNDEVKVTKAGMLIVRNIAMAFDPAVKSEEGVYSKTI